MASPKHILRSRWAPALALLGTLAVPASARADFEITYVFTDGDGNPQPQLRLTSLDMSTYANQATCQCGHLWGARIFLNNATGTTYPLQTQISTYVGANCDLGQNSVGQQQYPCAKLFEGLANDYDDGGILISFEQIWLSSRVQSLEEQAVEIADPRLPCDPSQTGGGGIWICVESNGQPNCQSDEFVIKGDQSVNATQGGSTGGTGGTGTGGTGTGDGGAAGGIKFDYIPPQSSVSGFRAEPGDGKVVITWSRGEVPDISGFRVLCADMDGNPAVNGLVGGVPTGRNRTNGKLYYTAENLCGDEVKWQPDPNATPQPLPPTTGDADTGRETDGTTDGTTSAGVDAPWLGDGWSLGGTATGGSTGGTSDGTGTTGDGTGTTGDGTGGTASGTGGSGTGGSDSGGSDTGGSGDLGVFESLDWAYVCSEHVTATGTRADVLGLANGTEYQFVVVAYDSFGNPLVMSDVLTATPIETSDFWEQCEQQGDLCGSGGFCSCTSDPPPSGAAWLGTGLLLLGLARRRGRNR